MYHDTLEAYTTANTEQWGDIEIRFTYDVHYTKHGDIFLWSIEDMWADTERQYGRPYDWTDTAFIADSAFYTACFDAARSKVQDLIGSGELELSYGA